MPCLDGLGSLRRLRELHGIERLPVVVTTAAPTPETEQAVSRCGADYLPSKPLDLAELIGRKACYR